MYSESQREREREKEIVIKSEKTKDTNQGAKKTFKILNYFKPTFKN